MKKYRYILEIMGVIASAVILFVLAYNIEIETTFDKFMAPFIYMCAALCLIAGIIMCTPAYRRLSPVINEYKKKKKEAALAKFMASPLKFMLRKTIVNQFPVLVTLAVLYMTGTSLSLSVLLISWCIIVLLYFLIIYYYYKSQSTKTLNYEKD